jgi:hypothetical protein
MSDEFVQAFSPEFMRVFYRRPVENCMNSGDGRVAGFSNHRVHGGSRRSTGQVFLHSSPCSFVSSVVKQLFPPVEAQDSVALAQLTEAAQRPETLAGIKVLVMLGNHQPARLEQPGLGEET